MFESFGGLLIVLGFLVLIGAIVGYVIKNPQVIGSLAKKLQKTQQAIEEADQPSTQVRTSTRPRTDDVSLTEQFRDLRVGEWVEYDPNSNALQRTEYQVSARGTHQALNRSGREFYPKGEEYPLYELDERQMLFERPDGWFVFDQAVTLEGESAREFDSAGETFSVQYRQQPRSYTFTWRGQRLTILDVGYMKYEHQAGKCHLSDGTMIKYMLAERDDGCVVYLENLKAGTDRVWIGKMLGSDLNPYLGRVLRATA